LLPDLLRKKFFLDKIDFSISLTYFYNMNTDFKHLIPKDFNANSRTWIYQADRDFTSDEVDKIRGELQQFNDSWDSHGIKLKSIAEILFNRFVILMADGAVVNICGGSVDESTRFIKNIEKEFSVGLFNRQLLTFIVDNKIATIPLGNVNSEIENGYITADTLYFNNTILTKDELFPKWIIPVKKSWLANRLPHFK